MRSKKPRIGITLSEAERSTEYRWPMSRGFDYLKRDYYESILKSGGIPVLLPNVREKRHMRIFLDSIDGLMITGGLDIHPRYFGQEPHEKLTRTTAARDNLETEMIKTAVRRKVPLLGICRGHQVLNVALGGDLYQDLSCLKGRKLRHADPRQSARVFHRVRINKDSLLYEIIGKEEIEVNSSHHQMVNHLGNGLMATAFAPDGIVEAMEIPAGEFVLSVQWHPEVLYSRGHSKRLFDYFVKETLSSR